MSYSCVIIFLVWDFFTFSSILGARPSKCKNSSGDNMNDNRRWRKVKARSAVPPGTQVIDLVNSNDVRAASVGVTMNSAATLALPSAAPLQHPPSASITLPQSCPTQQELVSTPAIVPSLIATAQISSPTH